MIYLRLAGGLGNQLYQLAAAALLANSHERSHQVLVSSDSLSSYKTPRKADSLKLINPNTWLIDESQGARTVWPSIAHKVRIGRWGPVFGVSDANLWKVIERSFCTSKFMDGYFQRGWTATYFSQALIHLNLKPSTDFYKTAVNHKEVVIHVRGGDFLQLKKFNILNIKFYTTAISQALTLGYDKFSIVSDDYEYAKEILKQIKISHNNLDIDLHPTSDGLLTDFNIIRAASAKIIGNSTFAWWASALGDQHTVTWSPTRFSAGLERDFYLKNEQIISI